MINKKKVFEIMGLKLKPVCWAVLISLCWCPGYVYAAEGNNVQLVGQWGYGSNEAVFIKNNYAYIGSGRVLVVLDVSDKTNPREKGEVVLEGFIESIYVSGSYAYIANEEAGLRVVDITNAAGIREVGYLDTPGDACEVVVSGHYAFVADNGSGLHIIDISNPHSPVETGSYMTGSDITGVFVSGEYVYIGTNDNRFLVIDISEPASPQEKGSFDYGNADITLNKICVSGNYAYVTSDRGLRIIDVSDPITPIEVGFKFEHHGAHLGVDVSGKYLYIGYRGGVAIWDISNPVSPQEVGYTPMGNAVDLQVAGNYVFAAAVSQFVIIDVTIPASPSPSATYKIPYGAVERIRVEGNIAYLVSPSSGIRLIDISNPAAPIEKGLCCGSSAPWDVFIAGNYAYAAVVDDDIPSGLRVIDVTDPASPRQVGSCDVVSGFPRAVWISGNYAYLGYAIWLGATSGGFLVIDITNPALPQEKADLPTDGAIIEFVVSGNYAYTAYKDSTTHYWPFGGMDIIDLANPLSPVVAGTTDVYEWVPVAYDVDISGYYAYLVMGNESYYNSYNYPSYIDIYNVSDPSSPQLVGTYENKGFTNGIYVSGNYAYTAEGSEGLRILSLASPTSPVEIAYYNTAGDARDVFVSGDYIYVADGKCGLIILKFDPSLTEKPFIVTDKTGLCFGAAPGASTSPQEVFVSNGNSGILNWTAASEQYWLTLTPPAGTGDGMLGIGVNPSGLSAGTYGGQVTIADPNAINSPQIIEVILTVYSQKNESPPFGAFETPVDNSSVKNSIPVTGWVLDDIEPLAVQVYREPVTGEGGELVYIGDAVFVEGARPDVQQAYHGYPFSYKAGWGYMLLTYFLPNGGNGTFTLHAIVTDNSGHKITLGTKTIICDNAASLEPFGAIDTPTQGGIASGDRYVNHGWALTPQPHSLPTDGSTIDVWVDGVERGHPIYNNYRSDVASLFPGYANSNGAGGYYYLDTTTFANGVHTIHWTAIDDAGDYGGIGSRYFLVRNSGAASWQNAASAVKKTAPPRNEDLTDIPISYDAVTVMKGYNKDQIPEEVTPDSEGIVHVRIRELDRLEVQVSQGGQETEGYLLVGNRPVNLPIGSTLDKKTGRFSWIPGPGFLGTYRLVFIETGQPGEKIKKILLVTIDPKFPGEKNTSST